MAGQERKVPGGVHYVCRMRKCDFYKPCIGRDGEQVTVEDDLVSIFAMLRICKLSMKRLGCHRIDAVSALAEWAVGSGL